MLLTNWYTNPVPCIHALQPRPRALGEDCTTAPYCAEGTHCPHTCPAVCTADTPVGTSCASPLDCTGSERCAPSTHLCVRADVGSLAPLGAPCGDLDGVYTGCVAGALCSGSVCVGPVADGADCAITGQCPSEDLCLPTADGTRHVCTRISVAVTEGAACTLWSPTSATSPPYCSPFAGLYCGDDGVCHRFTGAEGEPCGLLRCTPPLVCGDSSRCAPPTPTGGRCYYDGACASGYCDADTYVCAPACAAP